VAAERSSPQVNTETSSKAKDEIQSDARFFAFDFGFAD
jgi:hypothetical protein